MAISYITTLLWDSEQAPFHAGKRLNGCPPMPWCTTSCNKMFSSDATGICWVKLCAAFGTLFPNTAKLRTPPGSTQQPAVHIEFGIDIAGQMLRLPAGPNWATGGAFTPGAVVWMWRNEVPVNRYKRPPLPVHCVANARILASNWAHKPRLKVRYWGTALV